MAKEVKAPLGLKSNISTSGNKTPTGVSTPSGGNNNSLLGG